MASVDKRGGRVDFNVVPTSGWTETVVVEDDDQSAIDITGYTFQMTVSDDESQDSYERSSPITQKTYSGTIPDAAKGEVEFKVPAADFATLWGEQAVYGVTMDTGSGVEPLIWGVFTMEDLI